MERNHADLMVFAAHRGLVGRRRVEGGSGRNVAGVNCRGLQKAQDIADADGAARRVFVAHFWEELVLCLASGCAVLSIQVYGFVHPAVRNRPPKRTILTTH
jgi:hypothetical protein